MGKTQERVAKCKDSDKMSAEDRLGPEVALTPDEVATRDAWVSQTPIESEEARKVLASAAIFAYREVARLAGRCITEGQRRYFASQEKALATNIGLLGICKRTRIMATGKI
jgi:hypothetical protein